MKERAAERFALPALGRAAERRPTGKMLRCRKMLGIAPDSPASGARFVGLLLCRSSEFEIVAFMIRFIYRWMAVIITHCYAEKRKNIDLFIS